VTEVGEAVREGEVEIEVEVEEERIREYMST
jgi:hypothetical protein